MHIHTVPTHSLMTTFARGCLLLLAFLALPRPLLAQGRVFWQEGGVSIRDSTYDVEHGATADSAGGVIVVWADYRDRVSVAYYALRIDSTGSPVWPDTGVRAVVQRMYGHEISVAPDGVGGVVFSWVEERGEHYWQINAQRLSSVGTRMWGDSSVRVYWSGPDTIPQMPLVRPDGRQGSVVAWREYTTPDSSRLCVQRVDSAGTLLWSAGGVVVACDAGDASWGSLVDALPYGYVLAWLTREGDIKAQLVDPTGTHAWQPGGVLVCQAVPGVCTPELVSVEDGVVVTWSDTRHGNHDVFAQKLSFAGMPLWQQNGVAVCVAPGTQGGYNWDFFQSVRAVRHAEDDITVAFYDQSRAGSRVACQRLSPTGTMRWDSLGVAVGPIFDTESVPGGLRVGLAASMSADVILMWPRYAGGQMWEVRAQKVDALGRLCWGDGTLICSYGPDPRPPDVRATGDMTGGIIGCWSDLRFGWPRWSLYAQRCGDAPSGLAGCESSRPSIGMTVLPNPAAGHAVASFWAPPRRHASLSVYDVCGRKVRSLWHGLPLAASWISVTWDRTTDDGRRAPAGTYIVGLGIGGATADVKVVVMR